MSIRLLTMAVLAVAVPCAGAAGPAVILTAAHRRAVEERDGHVLEALKHGQEGAPGKAAAALRRAIAVQAMAFGEIHGNTLLLQDRLADTLEAAGERAAAVAVRKDVLARARRLHGDGDWHVTDARWALDDAVKRTRMTARQLAALEEADRLSLESHALYKKGQAGKALASGLREIKVRREVQGGGHPDLARALNNLAMAHLGAGDTRAALTLLRESLRIRRSAIGEKHPDYASTLNNLAVAYRIMGDHRQSFPLLRASAALTREIVGEAHPHYAGSLFSLGVAYKELGEYHLAQPLFVESLRLTLALGGENTAFHADTLRALGDLSRRLGRPKAALPLFLEAVEISRVDPGEAHPDHAAALNDLAGVQAALGRLDEALPLYKRAVALLRKSAGEGHHRYAGFLANLGIAHANRGEIEEALRVLGEANRRLADSLGPRHPDSVKSLANLAVLQRAAGRPAEALANARLALTRTGEYLDLTAEALSERQHLAAVTALRYRLNLYLSLSGDAGEAYAEVLRWKGAVLSRQRAMRAIASDAGPEAAATAARLGDATRRLARLLLTPASPAQAAARREAIEAWTRRKDELEADLSKASEAFRRGRASPGVAAVQAEIPAGAALVDFLTYHHRGPDEKGFGTPKERRLAAFILPPRGKPVRIDLGPAGPIEKAVAEWRASLTRPLAALGPAAFLRRHLWAPVERCLGGATTVLVSPDGPLARLPFPALPGARAGSYLVEEYAFAVVPVPQLLAAGRGPAAGKPSLLVLGGVEFGEPDPGRREWPPLPGTGLEAVAVKGLFGPPHPGAAVVELAGAAAGKPAVRAALPRHSHIHLATHGYFADPLSRSALASGPDDTLAGWHPLSLSGLVLAGANRRPAVGEEDGILTALEVAGMDLSRCELAVLSACETGLGEVAGGEGVLGLQRAFQVAGARASLCSLWSVSDAATSVLMERFYSGLWGKEKLSKLEALRRAQLFVLRNPDAVAARARALRGTLLKVGTMEADLAARGIGKGSEKVPESARGRAPASWWAAFVLSGDWR